MAIETKDLNRIIIICLLIAAVVFGAGYVFGRSHNCPGTRDQDIITKLDQALRNQQSITTELNRISAGIADSIGRIEEIEARAGRIEDKILSALSRYDESDRLLQEARKLNSANEQSLREILRRNEGKGQKD